MRRSFCCLVAAVCLFLGACGGGGSAPTAGAGGGPAAPPPPPGAGPAAPADGGDEGSGMPDDDGSPDGGSPDDGSGGTPPEPMAFGEGGEGSPTPDGGEAGSPDGGVGGGGRGFGFGGFGGGNAGGYNEGAEFPGGEGNPDGGFGPEGMPGLSGFGLPRQKSLREQAVDAYRIGDDATGHQLLLTHFAIVPAAGPELGEKMAWIPALRRPALGPRIGIAAFYDKPPRDFEGSPMPIGSPELAQLIQSVQQQQQQGGEEGGRRRRGNRGAPAAGEAGPQLGGDNPLGEGGEADGSAKGDMFFHTGDLGRKLLESLETRISSGDYGAIYKDISGEVARPAAGADPNNPEGNPDDPGADGGGGAAGVIPGGGFPGGEGVPGGEGGAEGAAVAPGVAQPLGLGVVWLGKVTSKDEAVRLAEQAQVDILVTYEIVVVIPRGGLEFVRNTTKIRISTLKKDDPQFTFTSAPLVNVTVANAQAKLQDGKEDPVDKEITRAIEALDKFCTAGPLPAGVTAEAVQRRLASQVAERPANPLPLVVEARFYVVKGLLPEAEMFAMAMNLMGEAEFSRLIAKSPGSGIGQMIGGALSLPGLVDLVRGTNMAATAVGMGGRRGLPGGATPDGGEGQPGAGGRGLRGLIPFGGPGR